MDSGLSLYQLSAAVLQMVSGLSSGQDALTADFSKHFRNILGLDFLQELLGCVKEGSLPASCRRAVISLLPKKGDLALLKNLRPVSLLCTDYKLLSKALSNRLKDWLELVVHFPVTRGIRKSCPISVTLSAYADNVTIFIRSQEDLQVLVNGLALYGRASSATGILCDWGRQAGTHPAWKP